MKTDNSDEHHPKCPKNTFFFYSHLLHLLVYRVAYWSTKQIHNGFAGIAEKNPFCYIDCGNEDECRIRTVWKWFLHICKVHFSFILSHCKDCSHFSQPQEYHVFPFTAIRALFAIMQMRKHAGNLIRAQIWFHMKDCLRGGGLWWHNTEQPNYAQCLFSQWATDTQQL